MNPSHSGHLTTAHRIHPMKLEREVILPWMIAILVPVEDAGGAP